VNKGTAVSFCSPEEKPMLTEIQEFLGKEIKVINLSSEDYVEIKGESEEKNSDWKSLMKEAEVWMNEKAKKKKKKK
ncbi:MAG: ATP-dependent helicase, partial [Opitutaceae bacterium]|nr:ATP-dependent helicase [Cytophagales bacterium]